MKKFLTLLILIFISSSVFSQTNYQTLLLTSSRFKNPDQINFQKNVTFNYKKLKTGGMALIAGGAVITSAGLFFLIDGTSNGPTTTYTTNSYGQSEPTGSTYDAETTLGSYMIVLGAHAIAGGIVMVVFANKKMAKKGMSFNYNPIAPTLTYRF